MFEAAVSELNRLTVRSMSRPEMADCVDDLRRLKGAAAALEMRLVGAIDRVGDAGLDGPHGGADAGRSVPEAVA